MTMVPLYHDPWFTFRFAEDRIIPRFHLEGVLPGSQISIIKIDPETSQRLGLLATAKVGLDGWVDLTEPIIVRAGEGFIAVPILICRESVQDHEAVRQVNRLAFGQDAEARLVDALRAGDNAPVSLVAEIEGQVVGHIMVSRLNVITDKGIMTALALAPMAVLPDHQRNGIGSALVRRGLEVSEQQGQRIVVVLGHPDF